MLLKNKYLSTTLVLYFNFKNIKMEKNMGNADKLIRLALAAILGVLYFMNIISGTLGIVLLGLAIVFALTSFVSFCPLYVLFGINTCSKKEK